MGQRNPDRCLPKGVMAALADYRNIAGRTAFVELWTSNGIDKKNAERHWARNKTQDVFLNEKPYKALALALGFSDPAKLRTLIAALAETDSKKSATFGESPGDGPSVLAPIASLPWLDVCLDIADGTIFKEKSKKLIFWFINKGSRAVVIRHPALERCRIPLHERSWKDITRGAYELKFMSESGYYDAYEATLRPGGRCETAIYPKGLPPKEVLAFQPDAAHQERDEPKFFVLRYSVVSEDKDFQVQTVY